MPTSPELKCRGCVERQHQIDDLRQIVMTLNGGLGNDDDAGENQHHQVTGQRLRSTYISESTQSAIDRLLLEGRLQADKYKEDLEKMSIDMDALVDSNKRLLRSLAEKTSEAELLSQQNAVYAGDFVLEREDRERAHGKMAEIEKELEMAKRRVVELEQRNTELMVNALAIDDQVAKQNFARQKLQPQHHDARFQRPVQHQQMPQPPACHHNIVRPNGHQCARTPREGGYDECDIDVLAVDSMRRRLTAVMSLNDGHVERQRSAGDEMAWMGEAADRRRLIRPSSN